MLLQNPNRKIDYTIWGMCVGSLIFAFIYQYIPEDDTSQLTFRFAYAAFFIMLMIYISIQMSYIKYTTNKATTNEYDPNTAINQALAKYNLKQTDFDIVLGSQTFAQLINTSYDEFIKSV